MKENKTLRSLPSNSRSILVVVAFLFYTAGFYFYSVSVFHGMPAYLRGFLVIGALICIPLLIIPYVNIVLHPASRLNSDVYFWLMLGYFLLWLFAVDAQTNRPVEFNNYIGTLISWAMLFILGRTIPVYGARFVSVIMFVFFAITLVTIFNMEDGAFTPAQSSTGYANYQAYAIVLSIVSFSLLYIVENKNFFWFITVATIILFAILGSRSELVAMIFATAIIGNFRRISVSMIMLQIIALSALYVAYILLTSTGWNRFTDFVEDGAESTLLSRLSVNSEAFDLILKYPVSGRFGSYAEGFYAHNFLSIWIDFGMLGAALYLILLGNSIWALIIGVRRPFTSRKNIVAISLWAFMVLLLSTTKSGHYYIVPFILGLIASHCSIYWRENVPQERLRQA